MIIRICLILNSILFVTAHALAAAPPLTVAAAADLAPLETALTEGFARAGGGSVTFVFGSSGMLARQIENGAPYDVYLSANETFVRDLEHSGKLVTGTVAGYATGRLGLWAPGRQIDDLKALLSVDVLQIAIPNPEHAPYGAAAKTMLEQLGLWSKLQPKTVLAENVRMAYQYAQTRNVDAVITSWTLLINEKGAHLLPEKLHPPLRQFGAVVKGTAQESRARAFLAFLLSPAGAKILEAGGLFPPAAKAR